MSDYVRGVNTTGGPMPFFPQAEDGQLWGYKDGVWKPVDASAAGAPGKTPVKGEDYWTEEDKAEIVSDAVSGVLAKLPTWSGGGY